MPHSNKDVLEDMRLTVEGASVRLLSMTEEESEARPTPDKWSAKEILGHLIDSATNNHGRFVTAQFRDDLLFAGYDQEAWVKTQGYRQSSWPALVSFWKSYNLHLLHVATRIPRNKLTQSRTNHNLDMIAFVPIAKDEPASLEYLIRDYVEHMKHHLRQILGG
jgi:DinB superfamily